jgi:hypothetical protein
MTRPAGSTTPPYKGTRRHFGAESGGGTAG